MNILTHATYQPDGTSTTNLLAGHSPFESYCQSAVKNGNGQCVKFTIDLSQDVKLTKLASEMFVKLIHLMFCKLFQMQIISRKEMLTTMFNNLGSKGNKTLQSTKGGLGCVDTACLSGTLSSLRLHPSVTCVIYF